MVPVAVAHDRASFEPTQNKENQKATIPLDIEAACFATFQVEGERRRTIIGRKAVNSNDSFIQTTNPRGGFLTYLYFSRTINVKLRSSVGTTLLQYDSSFSTDALLVLSTVSADGNKLPSTHHSLVLVVFEVSATASMVRRRRIINGSSRFMIVLSMAQRKPPTQPGSKMADVPASLSTCQNFGAEDGT